MALVKVALKYRTLNSLSSFFSSLFSVFILTILALQSSSTLFMIIPALLISLCLATKVTYSLLSSYRRINYTVLSTFTCWIPLNLDYSRMGSTYLLFDINLYL